jgi:hypothetical protein
MDASISSLENGAATAIPSPLCVPRGAYEEAYAPTCDDASLLARQLGAVRELLAGMAQLSHAGQCATMAKVVRFVTDKIDGADATAGWRPRHFLATLVEEMARESRRLCPDVGTFAARAENAIAVLAATA